MCQIVINLRKFFNKNILVNLSTILILALLPNLTGIKRKAMYYPAKILWTFVLRMAFVITTMANNGDEGVNKEGKVTKEIQMVKVMKLMVITIKI